jgi:hypothetical protein
MNTAIATQIILIMLGLIALLLWLDSPVGKPRDGQTCPIKGCKWHRGPQ